MDGGARRQSDPVIILGRFTPDRKLVLDSLRDELRRRDYLPMAVRFRTAIEREDRWDDLDVRGHARFVIADLTDAKSVPQLASDLIEQQADVTSMAVP